VGEVEVRERQVLARLSKNPSPTALLAPAEAESAEGENDEHDDQDQ
jgi:hypothetical protein